MSDIVYAGAIDNSGEDKNIEDINIEGALKRIGQADPSDIANLITTIPVDLLKNPKIVGAIGIKIGLKGDQITKISEADNLAKLEDLLKKSEKYVSPQNQLRKGNSEEGRKLLMENGAEEYLKTLDAMGKSPILEASVDAVTVAADTFAGTVEGDKKPVTPVQEVQRTQEAASAPVENNPVVAEKEQKANETTASLQSEQPEVGRDKRQEEPVRQAEGAGTGDRAARATSDPVERTFENKPAAEAAISDVAKRAGVKGANKKGQDQQIQVQPTPSVAGIGDDRGPAPAA